MNPMRQPQVNSFVMTDDVRDAVKYSLQLEDDKQSDMAERIGKSRQYVNGALKGRVADMPEVWHQILKDRGLKVIAVPADVEIDYHRLIREHKLKEGK